MAEYIEREALLREIERRERLMVGDKTISVDALKRFILNRPAADAAPVQHGRWVNKGGYLVWCSECNKHNKTEKTHYCPNCGAKLKSKSVKICPKCGHIIIYPVS